MASQQLAAQAQTQSEAQAQAQAPERLQGKDHFILGIGAGYTPTYQGSDAYRAVPVPVFDIAWGPVFANLRNGVGINVIESGPVTVGASVTYMPGYRRRDVPEGIGKLSLGAGGRGFASIRAGGLIATVGATKGFIGDNKGVIADATVSYPVRVSSRLTLIPTIGTTWADRRYNHRYFGVDADQAFASGLPRYRAGGGFKDASALLSLNYRLTDHIGLGASAGVTTLFGEVADSPLVEHKTRPSGFLSAAYRF
ncbi:MipA/OmpV family protein [Sphingomonas faeni]|uniref:MipA/OmpV family protein n=1 Tax=Sphingomonas faeni TaxID=185950 RepID=UPI0027845E71|nr:MipA/OmpV family protein [Sphingomonas faeni]MDQ0839988.1 outer membrane scaffolding protein for murein synthesis (MipA/OmpV family) [Sphingomonas faeni]